MFHVWVLVPSELLTVSVSVPNLAGMVALVPLAVVPANDHVTDGVGVPETLAKRVSVDPNCTFTTAPPEAIPLTVAEMMLGATSAGGGGGVPVPETDTVPLPPLEATDNEAV